MENKYNFWLGDDHQGNKILICFKGDYDKALKPGVVGLIDDPKFNKVAKQLIHILETTTVKDGKQHE